MEALARRLLEAGVRPWFDKWDLVPGESWLPALEAALRSTPAVAVCVAEGGLGSVHDAELQVALNAAFNDPDKRVLPVLLPGAAEGGGDLPEFLRLKTWVDYRREDEEAFARLVRAIRGERPGPPPRDSSICPYRGLEPFRPEHARFFYGREREVQELLSALRAGNRLLVLVGASGSGKSSLVLAGLVPAVRSGQLEGSYRWRVAASRPGADPCRALARTLLEMRRQAGGGELEGLEARGGGEKGLLALGGGSDLLAAARDLERRAPELDGAEERRALLARLRRAADRVLAEVGDDEGAAGLAAELEEAERLARAIAERPGVFAAGVESILPPDDNLLLVVDQLEELFTMTAGAAARRAFLRALLRAAEAPDGRVFAVVTVRADFLGKLLGEPLLAPVLQRSMRLALSVMEREQLERSIRGPARQVGLSVEDAVVDALVEGVAGEPGNLPLLQFALYELWRAREGGRIGWRAYTEMGGIQGAIARRAEEIYDKLGRGEGGERDQEVARHLLSRLVRLGEGTEDTRRRASRRELLEIDPERAEPVLDRLVEGRLLIATESEVEVAHEALIRQWQRLRRWLDEDRGALRMRQELGHAEALWRRGGGADADLWRGGRLANALEMREASRLRLSERESAFLSASEDRERRRREEIEARRRRELELARELARTEAHAAQRSRRAARWMAALGVIAAVLAGVSFLLYRVTVREKESARVEALRQSARWAVEQRLPARGLLLALEAVEADPGPAQLQVLREALSLSEPRRVLAGHDATVSAAAFAPDGLSIVTGTTAGTLRLWGAGGEAAARMPGHEDGITGVGFSPGGELIASASEDGSGRVWTAAGAPVSVLEGHDGPLCCVDFSPDGRLLVSGSEDGTARIWRPDGGTEAVLRGHRAGLTAAGFSPQGSEIVTASEDETARIWRLDGSLRAELRGHEARLVSAVFLPSGDRVLTASWDATARLWDLDGEPLAVFAGHRDGLYAAAPWPDGNRVVTASIDSTVRVWNLDGSLLARLTGHGSGVVSAAVAARGEILVTASLDGSAHLWRAADWTLLRSLEGHEGPLTGAVFSPDGNWILTASRDRTAQVWETDGSSASVLRGHRGPVFLVGYSPDGERLVSASEDGTARLWDRAGEPLAVLAGHRGPVLAASFSPDGRRILTSSVDKTARVWSADGEPLATLPHDAVVMSAQFSRDGTRILTASQEGSVHFWGPSGETLSRRDLGHIVTAADQAGDGRIVTTHEDRTAKIWADAAMEEPLASLRGHEALIWGAAFSPDARRVATASEDGTARIWDAVAAAGRQLYVLAGHSGPVWSAIFSPDGELVATGSADRTVRIWRSSDGSQLYTLGGQGIRVIHPQFSPDGSRVVTGGWDGAARVWLLDAEELILEARSRLHRGFSAEERTRFGPLLSTPQWEWGETSAASDQPAQ